MDTIIHKYLDNRIDIQEKAADNVQTALDKINIDSLIENPKKELSRVVDIALVQVQAISQESTDEGIRFAREVKKRDAQDKDILFVKSKNPNLNKGALDGDSL